MGEGVLTDFPLAGRKTTVEPAARIKSPTFRARYPDARNLDLINPGARLSVVDGSRKEDVPAGELRPKRA
ncbi:MAG TPA: hypothetical protein VMU82_04600 [Acetobacteraceae bacterium]|nr:hypothetical protein [Acetobacteraceae bacterium]